MIETAEERGCTMRSRNSETFKEGGLDFEPRYGAIKDVCKLDEPRSGDLDFLDGESDKLPMLMKDFHCQTVKHECLTAVAWLWK